jgi:hypothetical protein
MEIIRDYKKNIMNNNTLLTFGHPELLTGGTYFTKLLYNNNPLYIQTPKCKTKNGFIRSNKKIYSELIFQNTEEDMLGWFEYLDEYCKEFMLLKSSDWFNSTLTKDDIDTLWISTLKLYKSGKNILIKVHIPIDNNTPVIKIYDESERTKQLEDVNETTSVQTILEICGIKFTSKTYQLHVELKQMMIRTNVNNNIEHPLLNKCLIKPIYLDKFSYDVMDDSEDDNIMISPTTTTTSSLSEYNNEISKNSNNIITENILVNEVQQPQQQQVPLSSPTQQYQQIQLDPNVLLDISTQSNDLQPNNTITTTDIESNMFLDLEPINIDNLGMNKAQEEDITIKDPNVIYLEMYNDRLINAKKLLYASKNLFQEAKQIKEKYKLDISENINEYISD